MLTIRNYDSFLKISKAATYLDSVLYSPLSVTTSDQKQLIESISEWPGNVLIDTSNLSLDTVKQLIVKAKEKYFSNLTIYSNYEDTLFLMKNGEEYQENLTISNTAFWHDDYEEIDKIIANLKENKWPKKITFHFTLNHGLFTSPLSTINMAAEILQNNNLKNLVIEIIVVTLLPDISYFHEMIYSEYPKNLVINLAVTFDQSKKADISILEDLATGNFLKMIDFTSVPEQFTLDLAIFIKKIIQKNNQVQNGNCLEGITINSTSINDKNLELIINTLLESSFSEKFTITFKEEGGASNKFQILADKNYPKNLIVKVIICSCLYNSVTKDTWFDCLKYDYSPNVSFAIKNIINDRDFSRNHSSDQICKFLHLTHLMEAKKIVKDIYETAKDFPIEIIALISGFIFPKCELDIDPYLRETYGRIIVANNPSSLFSVNNKPAAIKDDDEKKEQTMPFYNKH